MIITMDDDVRYPRHLIEEMVRNSRRLPNAALGFKGFRLPPHPPYHHDHFHYIDSEEVESDTLVDVLGGVTSILYRSAFFDVDRLQDYYYHPSSAFFVDDEWIAGVLAEGGIPRVVLSGSNAPLTTHDLFAEERILPYYKEGALNGDHHAHRNIIYQSMLLHHLLLSPSSTGEGAGSSSSSSSSSSMGSSSHSGSFVLDVYDREYYPLLGQRAASFRHILMWLESLGGKDYYYVIVETGTIGHEDAAR